MPRAVLRHWKRAKAVRSLQFLVLGVLLCGACRAADGDIEIRSAIEGDEIVLRTSARYAGAVASLVFRGVEMAAGEFFRFWLGLRGLA